MRDSNRSTAVLLSGRFRMCATVRSNAANGSYRFTCGQPDEFKGSLVKSLEELNPLFNQAAVDPIQSPAQHVGFDALCDLNFPALL